VNTLLDRPPGRGAQPNADRGGGSGPDVELIERAVDLGLHFAALLLHAGVYVLLGLAAVRYDCGPHMLAGVLFGDFLGSLLHAVPSFRRAPVAAAADYALFAALFAWQWHHYVWPDQPEFRALFCLAGFGALTGRFGSYLLRAHNGDEGYS